MADLMADLQIGHGRGPSMKKTGKPRAGGYTMIDGVQMLKWWRPKLLAMMSRISKVLASAEILNVFSIFSYLS